MVRVLVADDHPVYREGVARAISERAGLDLVAVAADGREAMAGIREMTPDVAVLDVRMPGLSGIEIVAEIGRERLPTRVLLLSAQSDDQLIFDGVSAGASGYLLKDSDRSDICAAVEAIAAGRAVLAPEAQTALAQGVRLRGGARGPRSRSASARCWR